MTGGLLLVPASALAQSTPPAATTQPTTNSIGPAELQNFSLPGSVTRPSDQQSPAALPATSPRDANETPTAATAPTHRQAEPRRVVADTAAPAAAPAAKPPTAAESAPPPPALTVSPQPGSTPAAALPTPQPPVSTTPAPAEPGASVAPEHKLLLWPWLLAALAIAAGTLFLFWRHRSREVLAVGPQFDLFVPAEPAPAPTPPAPRPHAVAPEAAPRAAAPQPAPAVRPPTAPAARGIVSSRLRPQIEIAVQPLRCAVDDERVVLDFEIELFNAGAAPARSVTAEASLFNAGATQEEDLAAFFANPAGVGERLDVLGPMKRVTFTSQVVAPRAAVQEYELAGRKALVPVLGFNALYEWSGGPAQTSAAYLVGRETKSEKLGPLGVNGTPREFRALGARVLPTALRT